MKKYINSITLALVAILAGQGSFAQSLEREVINSCGGTLAPPGGPKLTQNIGETFATRLTGGGATLTQGYLQNTTSVPAAITGTMWVCTGNTTTLSYPVGGGTWSSTTPSVATVGSTGIVTGIAAGTSIISYVTGSTSVAATVTVQAVPATITGTTNICVAATTTLSSTDAGGVWSTSNPSIASIGSATGIATGVSTGSVQVTYTFPSGCFTTRSLSVNPLADAGVITGSDVVCPDNTILLSTTATGGAWSSSNASIATVDEFGLAYGVASGTAIISYVLPGTCGSAVATKTVTVSTLPTANPITGVATVCMGNTTTLSNTSPGGIWSSSNTAVGTVSAAGIITGISVGSTTISYMVTTDCGTALTTRNVTVTPGTVVGALTGSSSICTGSTTTLSSTTSGGSWTSSNPEIASVGTSGIVTGNATGTATISYSVSGSCGIARATKTVSVNAVSSPESVTGTSYLCAGSTTTLSNVTAGGSWSSNNTAIASVGSTGIVTGNTAGTATISYSVSSECGTVAATRIVTVQPLPLTVGGIATVCEGLTTTLTNATAGGGLWSNDGGNAMVDASGIVTGLSSGTSIISFQASTTGCLTTRVVTVNQSPSSIAATATLCIGATGSFTSTPAGGTWTSNNTILLSVNTTSGEYMSGGTSGGTVTVTYQLANGCSATTMVSVTSVPCTPTGGPGTCGTISLPDTVNICGGSSTPITATATPAGTIDGILWTPSIGLSSTTTASTTFTGTSSRYYTVTMMENAGPNLITNADFEAGNTAFTSGYTYVAPSSSALWYESRYTITTNPRLCHPESASYPDHTSGTGKMMCVNGSPSAANVWTQTVNVTPNTNYDFSAWVSSWSNSFVIPECPILQLEINGELLGSADTLLYPSGTWRQYRAVWNSGSATVATLNIRNFNTQVLGNDLSLDDLSFRSVCVAKDSIYVNVGSPAPAITVSGTASVCAGSTKAFSAAATGTWSSSNTTVASVGTSGIVTGNAAGTATISFHTSSDCFSTRQITVNPAPSTIAGNSNVCIGTPFTYSNATAGGVWSRTTIPAGAFAIDASTGLVTASAIGTGTITYAIGSCSTTKSISALAQPNTVSGTATMCAGSTTTLTCTTSGGTWNSSSEGVATVVTGTSTTGIVTGVTAGTATISYTNAGGCSRTAIVTVTAAPPAISGGPSVCVGGTISLTNATSGGTWSSSTPIVSSVNSISGATRGNTPGTATITYAINATCRTTKVISVTAAPGAITGLNKVCLGSTITLSHETGGGSWSSSVPTKASIDAVSGVVSGISAGTTVITYATGSGGCFTTMTVSVNALPSAIGGTASVCEGANTSLTNTTAGGGLWSNDGGNAMVGSTGIVTGISTGTSVISFQANTTGCLITRVVTVNQMPSAISGPSTICTGVAGTLTATPAGGSWTSSNTTLVPIGASTGLFTAGGTTGGLATISYSLSTGCRRTTTVSVAALPGALSGGTATFCGGTTINITASNGGLVWSSTNPTVATVTTLTALVGQVTGVATGTSTISYTNAAGCARTVVVTVSSAPSGIIGTDDICIAGTAIMSCATPGGTWSSSVPSLATIVSATGAVTGMALGTVTITYRTSTTCYTTKTINVVTSPSASITGPVGICIGSDVTFLHSSAGGTWSSSNTTRATVDAVSGLVSGISQGTLTLTYTVAPGCISTKPLTIYPYVFPISGTYTVCVGSTALLDVYTSGGTWSISNTSIGTLSYAGIYSTNLTGVSAGTATVTYMYPSTGCYSQKVVTVHPIPATITGPSEVCVGSNITLNTATTGGTWVSGAGIYATVDAGTGVVTGVDNGTVNITYRNVYGCQIQTPITVNALPGTIGGTSSLGTITGTTATLNCTPAGGEWTSSNTGVATIGLSSGVITSAGVGTTTITYTIPATGCFRTRVQTVVAGRPMAGTTSSTDVAGTTRIFPTPTTGMLTVEAAVSGNFKVMTIDGRIVAQYPINAASTTINLPSDLAAGIYMCRFEGVDGIVETLKVVLTK